MLKKYDSKIIRAFKAFVGTRVKILNLIFLFIAIFCIPVYSVCAIGNIHFGSLEIHPFLSITEGYVDNIYLAPQEDPNGLKKSSGYRSYTPGLRCDWNKEKYRIRLNYLYEIFRYDEPDVKDKDLYDLDSKFDLKFGKSGHGFDLNGGYRYRKTTDPYASEDMAEDRREGQTNLDFRINMRDRFGIALKSRLTLHRYEIPNAAPARDRDILRLSPTFIVRPFTKTGILLEYQHIITEYQNPNKAYYDDSETHGLLTGLEWEATAKLSGTIKAGYQWKEYQDPDPNRVGTRKPETWKVEVDLTQTFSEFTYLRLTMVRRIVDSTYQYSGQNAEFYYSNEIGLVFDHKLTYKVGSWIDMTYTLADYNNVPRKDHVWQFEIGFDYQFMDWIWAHMNYHTRNRESNNVFDYRNHQFNLGLNLVF